MPRRSIPTLLLAAVLGLSACGNVQESAEADEIPSVYQGLTDAVWYAETGDFSRLFGSADGIVAENGQTFSSSILVAPLVDTTTFVNVAYRVDLPDRAGLRLSAQVGFPQGQTANETVVFRVHIERDGTFPVVAEALEAPDGVLSRLDADLEPFRGQNVLLIFSVSDLNGAPLNSPTLWVEPRLFTP